MSNAVPLVSIVDDDRSIRRALRRLIQSAGYIAETFGSAREFLDTSPLSRTACLVLDIHLDGESGFDLQEHLAAEAASGAPRIPIIFITAHDNAATRERARQAPAVAYLRKPFDEHALLDAIRRAIGSDQDPRGVCLGKVG